MKKRRKEDPKEDNKQEEKKPSRNYSLLKDIREQQYYKNNVGRRDNDVRKKLEKELDISRPADIMPGQLVYFDYLTPKTKEDLEYYDARPVTIFFGIVRTSLGQRVVGFNLHYYPPRIRYQLMDRIFDMWKNIYLNNWEDGISRKNQRFEYDYLMTQLKKMGLEFGVRMYIPGLIQSIRVVPPKDWNIAVFTEGQFMKRTREAILTYWRTFFEKHKR